MRPNWTECSHDQWKAYRRGTWTVAVSWYWNAVKVTTTDTSIEPHPGSAGRFDAVNFTKSPPFFKGPLHHSVSLQPTLSHDAVTELVSHALLQWMDDIEDHFPFPAPPAQCGQVWRLPHGSTVLVTYVDEKGIPWLPAVFWEPVKGSENVTRRRADMLVLSPAEVWPPIGGSLVAGPGAPWSPPVSKPEPPVGCLACGTPAVWLRSTQFAGDHYFCDTHARAERDFGVGDSYKDWTALPTKQENP